MFRARDHHQTEEEINVNRIGTGIIENNPRIGARDGMATGPGMLKPHQLCGKIHQHGRCGYKCKTCGKPHREELCWTAHPEKAPRNFKSPRKDHQRGRGNSRDRQNGRNRNNSKERGGDNRPKSPRDVTGRVTTEASEIELEKILRKIEKAEGNKVNRVRKQLFEEEEEDDWRRKKKIMRQN